MTIRPVMEEDIDWLYEVGKDCYSNISEIDTKETLKEIINNRSLLFIRSKNAAGAFYIRKHLFNKGVVIIEDIFFLGNTRGGLEIVKLIRQAIEWGRTYGATNCHFHLGYESKSVKSLKPLAKRLKAQEMRVEMYNIDLV